MFDCPFCSRSFGRQEHLNRHLRIHTRERPYPCPSCSKTFSRLDVRNRHAASHEEQSPADSTASRSRACLRCASDRVRCSREQPCRRCSQRSFRCQYPHPPRTVRSPQRRLLNDSTAGQTGGLEPWVANSDGDITRPSPGPGPGSGPGPGPAPNAGFDQTSINGWLWTANMDAMATENNFGLPGLGLSDINWLSPQYQDTVDIDALLATCGVENNPNTIEQVAYTAAVASNSPTIRNYSIPAPESLSQQLAPTINPEPALSVTHSGHSGPSAASSGNRYYVDGTGARAPFGGRCQEANSVLGVDEAQHATTDAVTTSPEATIETSVCSLETYEFLMQGITTECRNCCVEINVANLPTLEQVQRAVRQYLQNFHPAFPFLRRSSFTHKIRDNWILLLAVMVVGSKFSRHLEHLQSNEQLLHLLGLVLTRCRYGLAQSYTQNSNDPDYIPGHRHSENASTSLSMLQAGILNIACMLHSGKQVLVERAHVERHYLVEACHKFELLSCSAVVDNAAIPTRSHDDDSTSDWLAQQLKIRAGAMIWMLDTIFAYEFQTKPLMQLDDFQVALPAHEDIWEQSILHNDGTQIRPSAITLREALELMDQFRLHSWTPTALPQRRHEASTTQQDWLPTTSLATKWRNSACDCLDILHWPANSKAARRSGFEDHNILQLHLARLIILTPTTCIQRLAIGPKTNTSSFSDHAASPTYPEARFQVFQWVIQDHCKARLSLVHCGALFWHVRRYSCDSLIEPYAIYIATLVLWAFCMCMQIPDVARAGASGSDETPEPSFLHLDRPLDDELVQTYVRLGHKMSAYIANVGNIQDRDAPARIAREGLCLLAKNSKATSEGQQLMASHLVDSACTWGIERSYRKVLSWLTDESEIRFDPS